MDLSAGKQDKLVKSLRTIIDSIKEESYFFMFKENKENEEFIPFILDDKVYFLKNNELIISDNLTPRDLFDIAGFETEIVSIFQK
jgi:hypothetical protein